MPEENGRCFVARTELAEELLAKPRLSGPGGCDHDRDARHRFAGCFRIQRFELCELAIATHADRRHPEEHARPALPLAEDLQLRADALNLERISKQACGGRVDAYAPSPSIRSRRASALDRVDGKASEALGTARRDDEVCVGDLAVQREGRRGRAYRLVARRGGAAEHCDVREREERVWHATSTANDPLERRPRLARFLGVGEAREDGGDDAPLTRRHRRRASAAGP